MNLHPSMQLRNMLPSNDGHWVAGLWAKIVEADIGRVLVFDGPTSEYLGSIVVGGSRPGFVVAWPSEKRGDSGFPVYEDARLFTPPVEH